MVVELPGHQEAPGDLEFFVFAVAGHLDDLDALLQRVGDQIKVVRAQQQHRVREVEGESEIAVGEARAGLGVEQLEESLHHLESALARETVYTVDHQHRIAHARLAQRAQDLAGLLRRRAARNATQFVGVTRARDADARERPTQGMGDRGSKRRLAGARWPDQAQRRARQVGFEPPHRQVLEDPFLGLGEAEMVALQDRIDVAQVSVLGRAGVPRQRPQPLEVSAHLRRFGGADRQPAQPIHLALRLARDLGGQALRVRPDPQVCVAGAAMRSRAGPDALDAEALPIGR